MLAMVLALVARLLAALPERCVSLLGTTLSHVGDRVLPRESMQVRRNIEKIYLLPTHSGFARMFARQVFSSQIVCAVESLREVFRPGSLVLEGESELATFIARAEAQGRGHMLVTGHLGAWELCALVGRRVATKPLHVLAKPARRRAITLFLDRFRSRMKAKVLWTDRKTILREMLGVLKAGGGLGFVMDQKPEGRVGPEVDFMGLSTPFVSGPATLAVRTNCAVISIFCVRTGPRRYRVVTRELLASGHGETDQKKVTQLCAREIERVVRLYPEQWAWTYRRWKFAEL